MTRVYIPEAIPAHGRFDASPQAAHHVAHVLRLTAGDALTVFDGRGHEYPACIERVSKSAVTLTVGEPRVVDRESPLSIVLAQGISSGERMDYTVQKAVELGIHSIQPLATERSVVRLSAERAAKRVAHWQAVAIAACEQCGRNLVPEVLPVAVYTRWLASAPLDALRVTLSPSASLTLQSLQRSAPRVLVLVGPEGGLAPRELQDAEAAGFAAVRLGPRVLRTETAALAAIAAMQTLWGDF
ncbi:MAG: rRNA (uracil1498-N3)-methyltransferase [Betaproteobacteria bacterium]|nr:rRNA (uracil1498-N3)-methyltransferase [Betaproteobacteria bacterium]